ncbi:EamA family transporter RarD [Pseudaeromonas paramecii]|uniref:EamA family transporter RarD n=1 Tax=Pseudaeromonas paramecii TaxID=2138166 RepID=A0ABP8Q194_9GAMM
MNPHRQGVLFAVAAFLIWGICPLYFKLLTQVPAGEILTHRIIWSCVLLLGLLLASRQVHRIRAALRQPRQLLNLTVSALLVAGNWLLFIWAVNNNHLLEASLGYYINPLFNVLLGLLFLGERLRRLQWLAVALASTGVLIQVLLLGHLPWIALTLAGSFGIYGLIRKQIPVDAQTGLFVETLLLLPLALIYLFVIADSPTSHLAANPWQLNGLLLAAGVVTTVPLLLFTAGARLIPLSTLGFIQYLGPSLMFLLAIFLYGEPIQGAKLLTFACIWLALALFSLEGWQRSRRQRLASQAG